MDRRVARLALDLDLFGRLLVSFDLLRSALILGGSIPADRSHLVLAVWINKKTLCQNKDVP